MAAEAVVQGPGGEGGGVPALVGLRAALGVGRAAVAGLGLWSVPTPDLRGVLLELEALVRVAQAAQVAVLGEVASRGEALVPTGLDPAATALLARSRAGDGRTDLAAVLGAHPATAARRQVTVAYVTGHGLPAQRAARTGGHGAGLGEGTRTGRALAEARISAEAADVVAATVLDLPEHYGPQGRAAAEEALLAHAPEVPLPTLRFHARGLLARAELTSGEQGDPGVEGADALGRAEARAHQRRELYCSTDTYGVWHVRGRLAPEAGASLMTAIEALAAPEPSGEAGPDLRSAPQRRADALHALAEKALAAPPASAVGLPTDGGARTRVVVTMDLAALTGAVAGAGLLPDDAPLSPGAVRRLACDAQLVPAVLGARSEPLDLGRAVYTVTPAQRRALVLRDRGCAAPGCQAPPGRCHAHHIRHWADGGPSDLANLVLVCGRDHRRIHAGHLHVHLADGGPVVTRSGQRPPRTAPPPWRARLESFAHRLAEEVPSDGTRQASRASRPPSQDGPAARSGPERRQVPVTGRGTTPVPDPAAPDLSVPDLAAPDTGAPNPAAPDPGAPDPAAPDPAAPAPAVPDAGHPPEGHPPEERPTTPGGTGPPA